MRRAAAGLLLLVCMCGCQLAFATVGSWTRETGIPAPISGSFVIPLADGRLGIFGGFLPGGQPSNETVLYDPTTGVSTKGAPMPGPAFPDIITLLRDGTVLVEGGRDINGNLQGATWLYDPAQNTWSQAGSVNLPRGFPSFALLSDGRLLIAGGGLPLETPEQTPNGEVSFKPTPSAEIYDPATRKWSPAGQLQAARDGIRLVAVGGGGAVAAGGCQGAAGWSPPVATAEVYDPATNAWSKTTPLPVAMCGADGVGLRDGRALIVDQYTFTGVERYFYNSSDDAFVYDPKTRAWSVTGGLAGGGTGTLMLSDGRVMVPEVQQGAVQGRTFKELVGGQIFDPATNGWTYASTTSIVMPLGYMFSGGLPTVVSLPNGSALVILNTDVLAFHPEMAPRSTQLLDSTGLTFELGAALLVIAILLVLVYRRASRSDIAKLQ
jgi:hypothetical protein